MTDATAEEIAALRAKLAATIARAERAEAERDTLRAEQWLAQGFNPETAHARAVEGYTDDNAHLHSPETQARFDGGTDG
jgi:hypothetical protein